jgi:hypothetical protein
LHRHCEFVALSAILLVSFAFLSNLTCTKAFGCQCSRLGPDYLASSADVIFVGKVAAIEQKSQLGQEKYVTFDVLKSWKGVNTETVTIRNGDDSSCGSYPLNRAEAESQYLVYANHEYSEIMITLCGGTIPLDTGGIDLDLNPHLDPRRDFAYLDSSYQPIVLKPGRTPSIDVFLPIQILGAFAATAVLVFFVIRRST